MVLGDIETKKSRRQGRSERHRAGGPIDNHQASAPRPPIVVAKSPILKRSINIAGRKTSVSLEHEYWTGLREIATLWDMNLFELIGEIDCRRQQDNLSSALRLFVLDYFRSRADARMMGGEVMGGRNAALPPSGLDG
jgi:predicted DNA-binding ribbon-helix-helix protein